MDGYVDVLSSFAPAFDGPDRVDDPQRRVLAEASVGAFVHTALAWERQGYSRPREANVEALATMALGTLGALREGAGGA